MNARTDPQSTGACAGFHHACNASDRNSDGQSDFLSGVSGSQPLVTRRRKMAANSAGISGPRSWPGRRKRLLSEREPEPEPELRFGLRNPTRTSELRLGPRPPTSDSGSETGSVTVTLHPTLSRAGARPCPHRQPQACGGQDSSTKSEAGKADRGIGLFGGGQPGRRQPAARQGPSALFPDERGQCRRSSVPPAGGAGMALGNRGGHRKAAEPVRPGAGDALEADELTQHAPGKHAELARGNLFVPRAPSISDSDGSSVPRLESRR